MDEVEEVKNLLNDIVVNKFSWDDFKFKNVKKSSNKKKTQLYNSEIYLRWILDILSKYKEMPNATAIRMNSKNNIILKEYISPITWLSYSPKDDDSLEDDEYSIHLKEV